MYYFPGESYSGNSAQRKANTTQDFIMPSAIVAHSRKTGVRELAIITGIPLFPIQLHVGRPNIGSEEVFLGRVREIFHHRWLSKRAHELLEPPTIRSISGSD